MEERVDKNPMLLAGIALLAVRLLAATTDREELF